jgi:hypothetical protein
MTTTASTLKLKTEISRITQILQANGVEFEEARAQPPARAPRPGLAPAAGQPAGRAGSAAGRAHARRCACAQVDLSLEPGRRDEMFAASATRILPQLHCDGKARSPPAPWRPAHRLALLQTRAEACAAPASARALPLCVRAAAQYLGDFEALQEMEDAGELGPLLRGE